MPQADLVLRGPLMRYPFREQEGRFELLLDYQDLVLDYQRDWPPIRGAAGGLRFLNQGLEIWTDTGRIYDTALTQGRTAIPDLWHLQRMLIHGEGDGPFADGLRVLTDTPLAAHLGPLARSLAVQGPVAPGPGPGRAADQGRHHGRGRAPELARPRARRAQPQGHARWHSPGSRERCGFTGRLAERAEAIRAQLWGRPVTLAIGPATPRTASSAATEIRARGRMPVALTGRPLPLARLAALASGDLDWDLGIELRNADLKTAACRSASP